MCRRLFETARRHAGRRSSEARRRSPERCSGQATQKTMASIYHAFDAPFAPVESKVETVRSATKCCFAFDL